MPGGARMTDIHYNPHDWCGCLKCPHEVYGTFQWTANDTFFDALGAARGDQIDGGTHTYCCGPMLWKSLVSSPDTFVNGVGSVRLGDQTICCGGYGTIITSSGDVFIN